MRIRTKLLLFFALVTIAPLVVVAIYTRTQINELGEELATVSRTRLLDSARSDLNEDLRHVTAMIHARRSTAEMLVLAQAREMEKLLNTRPSAAPTIFTDTDFDREDPRITDLAPSKVHFRRGPGATTRPFPVSESNVVFRPPTGRDIAEVREAAVRLAPVAEALREIRSRNPELVYWQYATMANGLHLAYPGHGGYPADYDPRERGWYREAMAKDALVWMPPTVDATTRRITLTVAAPFYQRSRAVGVTGIDVPLQAMIAQLEIARRWGDDAVADVLLLGEAGQPVSIVASRAYEGFGSRWDEQVELRALAAERPQEMAKLLETVRSGELAVTVVNERTRRVIWAAMATGTGAMAVLVRVPVDAVVAPALDLERQFAGVTRLHMQTVAATIALLLVFLTAGVVASAHSLSARVVAVSSAAKKVAEGELAVNVPEGGRDEIAELGRSFNTMIPQLQNRMNLIHSLNLAMEVQQSLLPEAPPKLPGLDISGTSIYCDETGGDYYDFLSVDRMGEANLVVAIGDVTGHGVAAAILMATARALLRSRIEQPGTLAQVFTDINRHMTNDRSPGRFMTMFCLIINARDKRLTWVSAGHDGIIGYNPQDGSLFELEGEDLPLGIEVTHDYHEASRSGWQAGTVLVAGTDGIWECMNCRDEFFGKERLNQIIRDNAHRSAEEISKEIQEQVRLFRGEQPQKDDVTLVVIRLLN